MDLKNLTITDLENLLDENQDDKVRCKILNIILNSKKQEKELIEKQKLQKKQRAKMIKLERKKAKKEKKEKEKIINESKNEMNKILSDLDELNLDYLDDVIANDGNVVENSKKEKYNVKDNLNSEMMNRLDGEIIIRKQFNGSRQFKMPFVNSAEGSDFASANIDNQISGFNG